MKVIPVLENIEYDVDEIISSFRDSKNYKDAMKDAIHGLDKLSKELHDHISNNYKDCDEETISEVREAVFNKLSQKYY